MTASTPDPVETLAEVICAAICGADQPRVSETRAKIRHTGARTRALVAVDLYRRREADSREVAAAWARLAEIELGEPTTDTNVRCGGEENR